jgi:2-keto-3-deoxy-L-rhamnonate aldolase RhmA
MNRVRGLLKSGKSAFGTSNFFDDPAVAEIVGLAGMDFIIIDMEDSPRGFDRVENMVKSC